mmetsp:Transcript_41490/g.51073  ORF Transcript_41490/g.51073 Transcript_41490/m.51073 type:complete len:258 (-) Transcript_41490:185-958(-)
MVGVAFELDHAEEDAVLLVKSTFLEFGDGLSLRARFRQLRKASTEPNLDPDTDFQHYERGIDTCDLTGAQEKPMEDADDNTEIDAASVTPCSSSEGKGSFEIPQAEETAARSKGKPKTTVMLRNLPNNYTRSMLIRLLDEQGFVGKYDFLYLPMDFERRANLGYAFVNLVEEDHVDVFWDTFDGFDSWSFPSSKVCQVNWSGPKQGLKAHVDRYKNSPVMHKSVPEEYKPMIFSQGVAQRFPAPTIRVQHPKKAGKQ